MKIMKMEPEVVSLRDAVDRLLEDSFIRPFNGFSTTPAFPVELRETKDTYVLKASLPGMKPEDIAIEATAEEVTLKGEYKQELDRKDEEFLRKELRYGKMERSLMLPLAIDPIKVEATFEHGIVTVTLPKSEVVKPKVITIKPKS